MRIVRTIAVLAALSAFGSFRAAAQPGTPLGTAQLQISGARLTLYSDSQTTDAQQTLNVGEPARIRTCYGAGGACGSAAPGSVAGLKVVGELTGPELPQAIPYETAPGGTFFLPGFQREGDYLLANIRLVETATGRVVANAEPSLATLNVRQILLASATVTRLTLADLKARGIAITQQNFNAFKFAVGFAFSGTTVTIELPVLYEGNGLAQVLDKPRVNLDGLPPAIASAVRHWEPPNIVPFRLNAQAPLSPSLGGGDVEVKDPEFPLYGAIVIPGNVSFLNQFFDARVIVANGAPNGSGANLTNVTGALKLPSGNVLRLAATAPPIAAGQKLPLLTATGAGSLGPGEQGMAAWTVEGLVPGTHVLRMDISADLVRPGREVLSTGGVVQAAVEVVDARFQLAFNHPDVVREGEPYSLYVTVTNLSRATQNLVTVELASESITGAHKEDALESFAKTIQTLEPGSSETLEYRLVADLTGQCVATTFQATGGLTATIHLRTGVGEAGIPLSPASLVLPRFTNLLPKSLLTANVRFLGLAYSLALAPAGAAPAGLPHVLKSDVVRRAVDLGEAGQRLYLQERLLESLETLALDQTGNRDDLEDYDTLRRSLTRAAQAASALGDLIRQEQLNRNLAAADLVDHFAATTDYGRPYLAAALVANGTLPAPVLEVRQVGAAGTTFLAYTSEDATRLRTIPYGEVYALADVPGGNTKIPFALVGRLDPAATYRVDLHAPATAASGRLILVVPTDDLAGFRKVDFGFVSMGANEVWEVRAVKAAGDAPLTFGLYFPTSGIPVSGAPAPVVTILQLPPFRVVGAVQDPELDRYGLGISYLFNRPPDKVSAETPANYVVRSTFHGQDTASPAVTIDRVVTKAGAAAFWQPNSERVVNVRYQTPISALNGLVDGIPVIRHEHLLVTNALRDAHGTPLDPQVPDVVIDPNRNGGLADGRVLRGDGTPVVGSRVQLLRWRHIEPADGGDGVNVLDLVAEVTTGSDGAFYFDFIEEPPPPARMVGTPPSAVIESVRPGFTLRAIVPAGADPILQPEEVEEVSTKVRLQNRLMHVNIALLGRGTVKGTLVYQDNGAPVTDGAVSAASTLFPEQRSAQVAPDGTFTFGGLPVGPITLSGRDGAGNRVYETVGIQRPGDLVNVTLRLGRNGPPKTGTVAATILRLRTGLPPVASPGAAVAVYSDGHFIEGKSSDSLGKATFRDVPAGRVTLQAADFSISRTPALTDLILAADETVKATLTLSDAAPRSVVGRVLFHDGPTNTNLPVAGAVAFIAGPGVFAYTDATGTYRIESVPAQGVGEPPYVVTAFDNVRGLQGQTPLPPIVDTGDGTPVLAADIFLASMSGGIDGVVLDPLGRPAPGVAVTLGSDVDTTSAGDGRFGFDNIAVGSYQVLAHVGDGLVPGKVGFFGIATATIVFGGHRPFVSIRMVGSGVVNVYAHSGSSGVLAPVFYQPTVFFGLGAAIQTTTSQDGRLTLVLPVGPFKVTAVNPFNGNKSFNRSIDYPGQVVNLDVSFDVASTVTGHVVGVDGVTPVPNADVSMAASGLLPQTLRTDGQGAFRFELVPQGHVSVTSAALVGSVDRVGRADGLVSEPGQTLDLTVVMKAQGTVRGRIVDLVGSLVTPLPFAQFYVQESAYPNRRLPAGTGFFSADAQGLYEVSHIFAGPVTVVARDRNQVERQGSARGEITADFQVVVMPDVVMTTSVGSIGVTVRDPDTGAPVPDSQVTLSTGDVGVADANGQASFDAMPLGTYSAYAFHAPTGRGGLTAGLRLQNAGDRVDAIVVLDARGQISGTLFDDPGRTVPVGAGIVRLSGTVNGRLWGTTLTALSTTSSDPGTLGRFVFDGIPPGAFSLLAGVSGSNRQAAASVTTTATAPLISVDLVLEPVADRFVRLFESLTAGVSEVNPASGVYALTLIQPSGCPPGCTYAFTTTQASIPYPGHLFRFPDVLAAQSLKVTAQESSGKERTGSISGTGAFAGTGTSSDPYRLVLRAKGRVVVTVRDALNAPAQANVTIDTLGGHYAAATDALGAATFDGVLSGIVYASARVSSTGFGGVAAGTLLYDDQTLALAITLAPAVSAHGVVYHPPPADIYTGDPSTLVPEDKAIVQIRDSSNQLQIVQTGPDGAYRFSVLRTGTYTISASNQTGESLASGAGTLAGPDGNDNALPDLILDSSRPLIVSLTPPPGQAGVSRAALVEIVFSESLLPAVLPNGVPSSPYFALRSGATGLTAVGTWTSVLNDQGQQVVRFAPSSLYDNSTIYSLTIAGGPGGVRDRVGRPLTDSGDVGSNFTTSDTVGASVIGSEPTLARPVDPAASIRFDLSEIVSGTASELDGDGLGDAAELFWQATGSSTWQPYPVTMFLTRGGYSLAVQPAQGVTLTNDSLKRRIHLSRLRDVSGNPMADYDQAFRIWDTNAPHVDVSLPPGAPGGDLSGGTSYTLTPVVSNLDDLSSGPGGDLDRVDYFLASASDPSMPSATPVFSGRMSPFAFSFVAAYTGNGIDPRPFSVWVQAVDTSTNKSNTVKLAMQVLPNVPPLIGSVAASAFAPVAGTFYAGSSLSATVAGVSDPDGAQVTLTCELRKDDPGSPNNPADLIASLPSQVVSRPTGGWVTLAPPLFTSSIPISTAEGTLLFFRLKATDALGASVTTESARFAVAHDPNAPVVDSLVARLLGASSPSAQFFIGQKLVLEFRARDAETAVRTTTLGLSGVFASPQSATLVAGTTNLYRTAELTVPATVPAGGQSVTATASATDWGGNNGTLPLAFNVSPTPDPYAPVATWLTPWEGGAWPSVYTSTVSPQGAALLLRVRATDLDRVSGSDVPGTIVSVQFKGPTDAAGTLAATYVDGSLVAGTTAPGAGTYESLWRVPNGVADGSLLPFEVRVVDTGGNATVTDVHLRAVRARKVYEASEVAVLPADTMLAAGGDPSGPVFLLDGAILSVYPQGGGAVRSLPSVFMYAGGQTAGSSFTPHATVLTAPEVTSYASSVLYNPLELTVTDTFGLGHGARVDMTAKGLLGSTPTQSMVLPGQTGGERLAGGSHGGSGGPGSANLGWARTDLTAPGSVYDSAKDPALPGGGGGYATGSFGATGPGGTGGGVVRLLSPGATLHLTGDLRADGADGDGTLLAGGGAGGSIRIVAGRVEGTGALSASGGRGSNGNYTGGGGGGRIALSFSDPPATALGLIAAAPGGLNNPPPDANAQQRAGAGTIYLEETDALGAPKAPGRLIVTNGSGKPAWPTPFTGAQRFGSVEGHGSARLVFDDDLTVGPDPGVLNDRTSVTLDGEARLLLKTEGPQISLTASPDGGDVTTGQQLSTSYTLSDPIGLFARTTAFSPSSPVTTVFADEPASVTSGLGVSLQVPVTQLPGPITYSVEVTDRAGRLQTAVKSWTVLPDAAPNLALSGVTPIPFILPGATLLATATATDNVGLASIVFTISGPVAATDSRSVTGISSVQAFSYKLPPTLTAGQTVTLQVDAFDTAGHKTSAAPVTWAVVADTVAPTIASVVLAPPTAGDQYSSNDVVTFTVTANDNVGVAAIRMTIEGVTHPFSGSPAQFTWTAPVVSATTPYPLVVEALDFAGNVSTVSRTLTVVFESFPTVSFTCPTAIPYLPSGYAGFVLSATASDAAGITKIEFFRPGDVTPFSTSTPSAGTPSPYAGSSTAITLPTVSGETVLRYRARAWNPSGHFTEVFVDVHVVPAVDLATATASDFAVVRTGTVTLDTLKTFAGLVVLKGAVLTHSPTVTVGAEKSLNLTVNGPTYIECGGAINVAGKGYPSGMTYPGAVLSGASGHLGKGGASDTYGSVARPQEAGSNNGGGIVRISSSLALVVDGTIAADGVNGASGSAGGAGGSVWLTTSGLLAGSGSVQARGSLGSASTSGSGGGAVALEFGSSSGSVVANSRADAPNAGISSVTGGAGTVLTKGPAAQFGELRVDPRGVFSGPPQTVLPSFGSGTAQPGTSGATLVTDRSVNVPAYFAGHWVEVRDSSGVLRGTWRIGTAAGAINAKTVLLVANDAETIALAPGDSWQGLYRFDSMRASAAALVSSSDPIEVVAATGTTIAGSGDSSVPFQVRAPLRGTNLTVEAAVAFGKPVDGGSLTVKSGAIITPAVGIGLRPFGLSINLSGALVVESGGAIDTSTYGYGSVTTYPGATLPGTGVGGGHLGVGGIGSPAGTFGSVTRPQEAGGGGWGYPGGGIVRVVAPAGITIDGAVRANGEDVAIPGSYGAGAGGSVWLTTSATLSGVGVIEASGGKLVGAGSGAAGGGGALALEYASVIGTIVANARAIGATGSGAARNSGAGTIWTKGAASTFGDLLIDNRGTAGQATVLPSLGFGTAQAGSGGTTLVTDRAVNVPAYFAGHWVEISDSTGALRSTCRVSTGAGGIVNKTVFLDSCSVPPVVAPGDRWQGVYRFDSFAAPNGETVTSVDPIRLGDASGIVSLAGPTTAGKFLEFTSPVTGTTVNIAGNVSLPAITSTSLTLAPGAVLSHPATVGTNANRLVLNVSGTLTVGTGAAIDATGRGYTAGLTYPGATTGQTGSHVGHGYGLVSSTFGSIARPQEVGGGSNAAAGGGAIRLSAGTLQFLDSAGAIRANAATVSSTSGAGGSVWITVGALVGDGTVEAHGGDVTLGTLTGGGGAIAVEYGSISGSVLSNLNARAGFGPSSSNGSPGSIFHKGPGSTFGALIVDRRGVSTLASPVTEFPSLGSGIAQAGTAGAVLVTDRAVNVPAYFAAHWVEIYDSTGTTLKGTWQISTDAGAIVNKTVTLLPNSAETISVAPGDRWQGVYRFDSIAMPEGGSIKSLDPARIGVGGVTTITGPSAAGQFLELLFPFTTIDLTLSGNVSATSVTAASLTLAAGCVLTHPAATTNATSLTLNVAGVLTIGAGASIDATGRGYPASTTYPGATGGLPGSHIGHGSNGVSSTFGSVSRPQEAGGGGSGDAGGGIARITAGSLQFADATGSIRANGAPVGTSNPAGGSVWITATTISGDGAIEARGGDAAGSSGGGGGAIVVEYTSETGSLLSNLVARGGSGTSGGAPGTVLVKGPASTYGTLAIDPRGVSPAATAFTELPSLGRGIAQAGTSGAILVTDRAVAVPAYFAGNWVEIYDATGATLKGTWRISTAPGGIVNKTLILVPNGAETISIAVGDRWQGVYLFDALTLTSGASWTLMSGDPIRVAADLNLTGPSTAGQFAELRAPLSTPNVVVNGNVSLQSATVANLTVKSGATLTHPAPAAFVPSSLVVSASGTVTVESGGAIEVSGRGYTPSSTYPGATGAGLASGGSHLGYGGLQGGPLGSTFGSIYRPQEAGAGPGGSGAAGGGAVRISANTVQLEGSIRANGANPGQADGAGGSVWIAATNVGGAGSVEARGGAPATFGTGGGGAISIEYASAAGSVLSSLSAAAGAGADVQHQGGAGTVYVKGPSSIFGDLTADNGGRTGQATDLPSLGAGTAQAGTSGATLVTARPANIPAYFAGHFVEISDSSSVLKGTCRISTAPGGIVSKTVTLDSCSAVFSLTVGDKWQGVYRFDNAPTISGGATLTSTDPIRIGGTPLRTAPTDLAGADPAGGSRAGSVSLCADTLEPLKPGSSFTVCLDAPARDDVSLEISGAFEARIAGYGNCREPIAIPGSARPGPLRIVATARDAEGKTATASARSVVVADERAPVLVSVEPDSASLRSGDPLRVAVETWDDVGISSVAITLGGRRTVLTAPPFEIRALAPPVASNESLEILVEVFDPSGNVSRRATTLNVVPAGARLPAVTAAVAVPERGISFEDGRLSVDGGWPWRDADGESRGRTLELPAIGSHTVLAVEGAAVALDGIVARGAAAGGSVDVRRGDAVVGRFRILSVSDDGTVLRLEGAASGRKIEEGDFLEGNWTFDTIDLARGAILRAADAVEAGTVHVDASSLFLSKNIQIPSSADALPECPARGPRPDPPGTPPEAAKGVAP